jgi:hypothetical protein
MKRLAVLFALAILAVAGCSSTPQQQTQSKPVAKTPAPPNYETGRVAFQRMYAAARLWQPDAQPIGEYSDFQKGAPVEKGQQAIWHASFASPSRRQMKPFLWSGVGKEDERGVSSGHEDVWSPSNTSTMNFDINFLKVDSDKAFQVAQEHGGKKLTEKNADLPVNFALDWNPRVRKLIWHVIYGSSEQPKLRVAVNATTGEFLAVEK